MLQSHFSSSKKDLSMLVMVLFLVCLLPFAFFFLWITDFTGMPGDGEKWLCSWSFDTACLGRGQLIIIQLTLAVFVLTPLYSTYIPGRLAASTLLEHVF